MNRFTAAGIHLAISSITAILIVSLMLSLWYPGGYFKLMGGLELLILMIGIDVCLGPLLTLIVYKQGKKSLKFDLSTIAILQIIALSYGIYIMFNARPVYTVFVKDQFHVVSPVDITPEELSQASRKEWQNFSITGPINLIATPPEKKEEKDKLVFEALAGKDLESFPKLYKPYHENIHLILAQAKPLESLRKIDSSRELIDSFIRDQNKPFNTYVYLPIKSKHTIMTAVLDSKTANIVKVLDIPPPL